MRWLRWMLALCSALPLALQGQALTDAARREVAAGVRAAADQVIAAIASKDIDQFMALFTDAGDLVYVDNGKIYPSREALATAAGGFFKRIGSAGGHWDPAHVLVLSPTAASFTGIFRPQMVDTAGTPLWTDGKVWTFVYERRGGAWKIVHAHEVNARPGS